MASARPVIKRTLSPRVLIDMTSYDEASTVHKPLARGVGGAPGQLPGGGVAGQHGVLGRHQRAAPARLAHPGGGGHWEQTLDQR
jgi:hypothetical protein